MKGKRKNSVGIALLCDVLAAGIILLTFAYCNHGKDYLADRRKTADMEAAESESTPVPVEASAVIEPVIISSHAPVEGRTAPEGEDNAFSEDSGFKFEDKMSEETIISEDSYRSRNISFSINKFDKESGVLDTPYLVADIYVRDPHCIQSYFAGGSYSSGRSHVSSLKLLSKEAGAVLSINGDYYISQDESMVLRNGVLYRKPALNYDALALYEDGTMKVFDGDDLVTDDQIMAATENAWQIWSFGPSLLDENGKAVEGLEHHKSGVSSKNPRTAIGYYEPGHYCFVIVEGRRANAKGCTFDELAYLMEQLGCRLAYNLDGGASSSMVYNGKLISDPPKERSVPDIIYLAEYADSDGREQ